jgi:hypothetical protein
MRRREKILLAIFVAVVLLWQGGSLLSRLVLEPIQRSRFELSIFNQGIAEKQHKQMLLARAEQQLDRWNTISLPSDPLNAQRLYQQWLTDMAQNSGFSELNVFPERVTNKNDACIAVVVSIEAEATLDQLCLFLYRFYRTDLLHEIVSLDIDSQSDQGDPPLRVTVIAEGLALEDAAPHRHLFPQTTLSENLDTDGTVVTVSDASEFPANGEFLVRVGSEYLRVITASGNNWTVNRGADHSSPVDHESGDDVELVPVRPALRQRSLADYRDFIAQNPFAKPPPKIAAKPKPAADVREKQEVGIDAAQFVFLVGAVLKDQQREAWLYDRLNNQMHVISSGKGFSIAGIDGVVLAVGPDYFLFEHADASWHLKVGKNLRAMQRAASEAGDSPDEATSQGQPEAEAKPTD